MIEYAVTAAMWSAAGFAVGWVLGGLRRDVNRMSSEEAPMADSTSRVTSSQVRVLVGAVIVILAVASVVAMVGQVTERQAAVECRLDLMRRSSEITNQRAELAGEDRRALNELIAGVFAPDATDADQRHAYERYQRVIAANQALRDELEFPADTCTTDE